MADTPVSEIAGIVEQARESFASRKTLDVAFRKKQLQACIRMVSENEDKLKEALKADLGATEFWASVVELDTVKVELKEMINHIDEWTKPESKSTPLLNLPAKSFIQYQPFGVVLSISPWNYPVSLCLVPLMTAIAAGNVVVAKPSEISVHTSRLLAELVPQYIDNGVVKFVLGGVEVSQALLKHRFDFLHYTGGTQVGKIVYKAAAEYLTPVLLELGGKSPTFVTSKANIKKACQRIAWGKWTMNMGQTCISPDYVLVHKDVEKEFLDTMKQTIIDFYGDPKTSTDISRMISQRHLERVAQMLQDPTMEIVVGGDVDAEDKYISPTLACASQNSRCMQEEIFGPILPVISVSSTEEAINFVLAGEKPLSLYVFSEDSKEVNQVLTNTSSGGACVNDTVMHCGNPELPFGGVGESGIGAYHGREGFKTFSHKRSVLQKFGDDVPIRFPPYTKSKLGWLNFIRGLPLESIVGGMKYSALIGLLAVAVYLGKRYVRIEM
eukprot:m.335035 g.335035  ORF g.335035 m.335035 type:complete len:497 (+) comp17495_c0_seq1:28-1518(+)